MIRIISWIVFVCVLLPASGGAIAGESDAAGGDKTLAPYFYVEGGEDQVARLPLKSTSVTATVNGMIAEVTVVQTYANTGSDPIHARYIFPASTRAAVHGMRMQVGEQVVVARIQERQAAEADFTKAKTEGKSASLMTEERPNVFSMRVANIMPGDTVRITLTYTELLVPTEGVYAFVFPTVVGPRYSNLPEKGAPVQHQWIKNPYLQSGQAPVNRFDLSVAISSPVPISDLQCPTHETDINWQSSSRALVRLAGGEDHGNNRDFVLRYRLSGDQIQSGLMLFEGESENVFLMTVQPPKRVQPETLPAREYIFVVDVSGSMHGFPLDTAKGLLGDLIGGLRRQDTFNVVLFAGGAQVLAPGSVPATTQNLARAKGLIDAQQGGGSTELRKALETAMALPRTEGSSRSIVVVTDGYISLEKEVFALIQDNLDNTNVFSFGIGSSVNRYLIEGIARAGQGEPFVVLDPQEAPAAADRFKRYIDAPVLTGIAVSYDGFEVYDLEPAVFGDLFANRPLVVCGKWRGRPRGTITVTGRNGEGLFKQTLAVDTGSVDAGNKVLPVLWARKRLARLTDFDGSEGDQALKDKVVALGLTYHLLTPHTAFIAVDETVRNTTGQGKDVDQPLPLPLHVSNLAVGGGHSTAEPELILMVAVFALCLLGPAVRRARRRRQMKQPDSAHLLSSTNSGRA